MLEDLATTFWDTREGRSLEALGLLAVLGVAVAFAVSSPGLAAVLLLSIPAALYILGRVGLGLWLVVALTPIETVLGIDFVLMKAMKLGLVALVTCGLWLDSRQRRQGEKKELRDPYWLPMSLFLLTGFVASLLASSPVRSALGFASLLLFVSYYFMARDARVLLHLGPRLLRTIILVAVPTAVLALLQLTQGYGGILGSREQQAAEANGEWATIWPSIERASATFNNPGAAGTFLALATIIAVIHSVVFPKNRRGYALLAVLSLFGILATFARGPLVGLLSGLGFAFWTLGHSKVRWRRMVLILSIPVILSGLALSFDGVRGYLRLGADVASTSITRVDAWRAAASIFRRNPFVGIGFYGFQEVSRGIEGESDTLLHPHNGFLKAIVEQGLLGGFAYLLFLAKFVKTAMKCLRTNSMTLETKWILASINSIGVSLFTEELFNAGLTIGGSSIAILFATLLGLQVCMLRGLTWEAGGPTSVPCPRAN